MGSSSSKKTTAKSLTTGAKTGVIILPKRKLKKFPSQLLKSPLEQFSKVRSLDLSSNYLVDVNVSLAHFKSLKTFNLSGNRLTRLTNVHQLSSLQNLDISNNQLIALPTLPLKIQKILASHNNIAVVDCTLKLSKLKELDLSHNVLVGVTSAFFQECSLDKLERLDLSHNSLEAIATTMGVLPRLVHLDISNNRLATLPQELGQCKTLQTVLATHNILAAVPTALLDNGALSKMRLEGNRISKEDFLDTEGADEFMERRKARIDREIHGGMHSTDRTVCGLDDLKKT